MWDYLVINGMLDQGVQDKLSPIMNIYLQNGDPSELSAAVAELNTNLNLYDPDQIVYINSSGDPISQYEYAIRIGKDSTIEVMGSPYGGTKMQGSEHFSKTLKYTEIDSCFIANEDSFQQTLIYNGKDQNTLKFSYREYSNSQIRDAFTTNVTYDLNESNVIGYKNFKAEIIEADNMRIRYKIISGF